MTDSSDTTQRRPTAFVTGATGLLGNNLVRELIATGWRVRALVRSPDKARRQFDGLDVETVRGDMLDVPGFAPALAGVDTVFHTAAYFRDSYKGGRHWDALFAANVEGTRHLLDHAYDAGVRRFVHGRAEIQTLVKDINRLRNRVAHHEHILDMNIPDLLAKTIRLTELSSPVTAGWMRHYTTVNLVMRSRPNLAGSAPATFAGRCDRSFAIVSENDTLLALCGAAAKSCAAFVCIDHGVVAGAFTHRQALSS